MDDLWIPGTLYVGLMLPTLAQAALFITVVEVEMKTLVLKEAEIIASRTSLGEMSRALTLLANGILHPDLLITDEVPLRDITAAFAKLDREAAETIKLVVDVRDV